MFGILRMFDLKACPGVFKPFQADQKGNNEDELIQDIDNKDSIQPWVYLNPGSDISVETPLINFSTTIHSLNHQMALKMVPNNIAINRCCFLSAGRLKVSPYITIPPKNAPDNRSSSLVTHSFQLPV